MKDVPSERQSRGSGGSDPDDRAIEIHHEGESGHHVHTVSREGESWDRERGHEVTIPTRRLSWGAIFAGLFVAIGVHLILGLFGIAVGFSSWSPGGSDMGGIATAVGIWALISGLIALFLGGATTGHLAGRLTPKDGFLHGAILWSLATLATIWLVSNGVGFLLGGAFNVVGQTAAATVNVAGQAATEIAPVMIESRDRDLREQAATALSQRSGMTPEQAREAVATVMEQVSQANIGPRAEQAVQRSTAVAENQARQLAQNAADTTASGAWWTLLALGLSLGAAGLGAATTAKREMEHSGHPRSTGGSGGHGGSGTVKDSGGSTSTRASDGTDKRHT